LIRLLLRDREITLPDGRWELRHGGGDDTDIGRELGAVGACIGELTGLVTLAGIRVVHGVARDEQSIVAPMIGARGVLAVLHGHLTHLVT
jgi:hypothetical protein